jgi:SagB-type dehydrogenase family enzyme
MKANELTAPLRAESGEDGSAWYIAEGKCGEELLNEGQVSRAIEVFESILTRLGDAPSYGRAVILGRLGRCCHMGGRPDLAVQHVREAIDVIGRLAPSDGVKGLRGTLRSELGDALRAGGQYRDAKKAYEAALKIAEELKDLRAQGVEMARLGALALAEEKLEEALTRYQAAQRLFQQARELDMEAASWQQLARVFQAQRQWDTAERHYHEAARISEQCGQLTAAADTWNQLAVLALEAGKPETAEGWYRKALEIDRRIGTATQLAHRLNDLSGLLRNQPGRLGDARQVAEEAIAVAQSLDPAAADAWKAYGILADIADTEARFTEDRERRATLEIHARNYRELQRHAPIVFFTLASIGDAPRYGRAVILGHAGRCWYMGGRPDLAIPCVRDAIELATTVPQAEDLKNLRGALHLDLGDMLRAAGQDADARTAYEAALTLAEGLHDVQGQLEASHRLGRVFQEQRQRDEASPFDLTICEDVLTEYVFDTDLLIDGPHARRIIRPTQEPSSPDERVRPMVPPPVRLWMDEVSAIRFSLSFGEPAVERHPGCTSVQRTRREVIVSDGAGVLWRAIGAMDGLSTLAEILCRFPAGEREVATRMIAALADAGAIDVSGRPLGRFIHRATKKGVLAGGGLDGEAVLRLAADGNYRIYPDAPRVVVNPSVPDRLRSFHALTRSRRSTRDFSGAAVTRADFDGLLSTACGVTGAVTAAGREVKLRAYPSSGALYAVEIYPVVFRVEGLEPAVYHYRASDNVLEVVRPAIDPSIVVGAALPVERNMVAGAAVLVCLTGCFARHERKYGPGGYRMLVAEAGHISQNLILAATALGLSARPFGGVFDDLLNRDLGLDADEEQFLLAVVVGRARGTAVA